MRILSCRMRLMLQCARRVIVSSMSILLFGLLELLVVLGMDGIGILPWYVITFKAMLACLGGC